MENRKDQIINLTIQLIKQKGFVAISYDDLSKPLGVTKASIHYHFEKKEDLGIAVTNRMLQKLDYFVKDIDNFTPSEQFDKFIANRIESLEKNDICLLSSLQADFQSLPQQMKLKVTEVTEKELTILSNIIASIQAESPTHVMGEPQSLALFILASGKGILQYQRALGQSLISNFVEQISRFVK